MSVRDLVEQLDILLKPERFASAEPFRASLPALYGPVHDEWEKVVWPAFRELGNGLLVAGEGLDEALDSVALGVFPSSAIIDQMLADATQWSVQLLILHHPAHYKTETGWEPIPLNALARLREAGVSIYAVHTPLDVHETFGISANLARTLALEISAPFYRSDEAEPHFIGVTARPALPVDLKRFCDAVQQALAVPYVDVRKHNDVEVARVAVIGGGGHTVPGILQHCSDAGCDTFLTGTVIERVPNERWQRANAKFLAEAAERGINLVGASHCATEKPGVLALAAHLKATGYHVRFLPCGRPWE